MSLRHHAAWMTVLGLGVLAAMPFARTPQAVSPSPESTANNANSDAALFLAPQPAAIEVGWEKSPVNNTVQMLETVQVKKPPIIQIPEVALEKPTAHPLPQAPPPSLPVEIPEFHATLKQSKASRVVQEPVSSSSEPKYRRHRVVDGDDLRLLALRYYGSEQRASEIQAANSELLRDATLLPVGQEILIPLP